MTVQRTLTTTTLLSTLVHHHCSTEHLAAIKEDNASFGQVRETSEGTMNTRGQKGDAEEGSRLREV